MTNFVGYYDHLGKHLSSDKHAIAVGEDKQEIEKALEALSDFCGKKQTTNN